MFVCVFVFVLEKQKQKTAKRKSKKKKRPTIHEIELVKLWYAGMVRDGS